MAPPNSIDDALLSAAPEGALRLLREVLEKTGFTESNLATRLSFTDLTVERLRTVPGFRAAEPCDELDALMRLFLIGLPVRKEAVARALEPLPLASLGACGLIASDSGSVTALVRFFPNSGLVLAHDPPDAVPGGRGRRDFVPGITESSVMLQKFTPRSEVDNFLDLGTGIGVQALAAARHSRHVCATDRSTRALRFACFNARFNGITNVETLEGDRFEPVRNRRFNLIVSNPPFMISPGERYVYRDSGMRGDDFCRSLVRDAPALLEERGLVQFCGDWIQPQGGDWRTRLSEWFEGTGCDALVLRMQTRSPSKYADEWIRETDSTDPEIWGRLYDQYLYYYDELGIEAIHTGAIILRKRSAASNRVRFDEIPDQPSVPVGASVALAFDLGDALEQLDDAALLGQRLRLNPDTRLEQIAACEDGRWRPMRTRLHLAGGLEFRRSADLLVAGLLARCDGKAALRELLVDLAGTLHRDVDAVVEKALPIVRQLIETGYLLVEKG